MSQKGKGLQDLSMGGVARLTLAPFVLCAFLIASGQSVANNQNATPNDLKVGFCTPFIKQRYETTSLLVKLSPSEKIRESHQRYEAMFNKLRRFVLTRTKTLTLESLEEFMAAVESGTEEKNRIDSIRTSCISDSIKDAEPPNDRISACFKRRNVEFTKYEECEKMDFLPY